VSPPDEIIKTVLRKHGVRGDVGAFAEEAVQELASVYSIAALRQVGWTDEESTLFEMETEDDYRQRDWTPVYVASTGVGLPPLDLDD
jgi:lipoate-protein ligase A